MRNTRAIRIPNFFGSSGSGLLLGGLALLLMFLGSPKQGQAQGCDNNDSIYQGGAYCIAATTLSSGNNPMMPSLSIGGGSGRCTSEYVMELDFAQPGDPSAIPGGNGESYGFYDSGSLPGGSQWIVNWKSNGGDVGQYSEGGHGDLQDFEDGTMVDEFPFIVYGQNPGLPSITAVIASLGAPWWYGHTLTWETLSANLPQGNVQFYSGTDPSNTYVGSPAWGYPDGFGLSQLDGSPSANPLLLSDNSLWTWTTNLLYGVQVANGNAGLAYSHFQAQMNAMYAYTGSNGLPPQYPNPVNGYCNLTGTSLTSNYWEADWINKYNGGFWANWTGSGWSYGNSTNPTYTTNVCNQPSHTI